MTPVSSHYFMGKVMFIETAVKNIALEQILIKDNSEKISEMLEKAVSSYSNAPSGYTSNQRQILQESKLNLQKSIQSNLASAYHNRNPKITHFYDTGYADVPIWALFEIMTMGDFGHLLQCLTYDVRDSISRQLGINNSCDTDRKLIYQYIYLFKDLRNAIAHNAVVFDTRFRNFDPSKAMRQCLKLEIGVPYVNFDTIGDYVLLMGYFLKLLHVTKTELKAFVREFESITGIYERSVSTGVSSMVIHPDLSARMEILKNYFKNA